MDQRYKGLGGGEMHVVLKGGLITCPQRQRTASWFENIPPYVKSTRKNLKCERFNG